MCSDKSNKHILNRKLDYHYQPIIISTDIKHIMLITNIIRSREIAPNICECIPSSLFSYIIPALKSHS